MRFAWIHVEKATHAVRRLCRVLAVTPSGYYAWLHRRPSPRARDNARLQVRIRAIHAASRGTYGSPRVHKQLIHEGDAVGRERVARLLRAMGMAGLPAQRFRHSRRKRVPLSRRRSSWRGRGGMSCPASWTLAPTILTTTHCRGRETPPLSRP